MSHQFSQVPKATIPRSSFNRSCGYKTTFDAGLLIPFFVDEALPGDTFNLRASCFGRLATPLKPIMDNLFMETFYFFVPNRLIWDNWQKFNGEQDNPADSTDFSVPTITSTPTTGYVTGDIHDYFGLPIDVPDLEHSALWHRAYALIWNQWFRDQNLQDSVVVNTDDGPDDPGDVVLQRRGKRHDYFTSGLPFPQKGDPVSIDIGGVANISTDAIQDQDITINALGGTSIRVLDTSTNLSPGVNIGSIDSIMYADLSTATGFTINDLRQAFQVQKLLERDARGGTRYTEIVRSHFGVVSPDARLQRPEFLGGGSQAIQINPVAQTSDQLSGGPGAETPQGNLAAFGTVTSHGHGFTKSFTEHGVIIGLVNVRADLTY